MEGENRQKFQEWTTYTDFEKALSELPVQYRVPPVKANPGSADKKLLTDVENDPSHQVYKFSLALRHLYENRGGLHIPYSLTVTRGKTSAELQRAFFEEIDWLWKKRKEREPIATDLDKTPGEDWGRDTVYSRKLDLQKAKEKLEALQLKAKIMGPKKRARFESEFEFLNAKKKLADAEAAIKGNQAYDHYVKQRQAQEVVFRTSVNELLPKLSGEEYFDAMEEIIRAWLRGVTSERKEMVQRAFEDALLAWALQHAHDTPVIGLVRDSMKNRQPDTETILKPMGRRLLEEIHRIHPLLKGNSSPANLQHARLLIQAFTRISGR